MTQPTPTESPPQALACQDCNRIVPTPLVAKKVDGKMYVAALCPDCILARWGLEWRQLQKPSIVVPHQGKVV